MKYTLLPLLALIVFSGCSTTNPPVREYTILPPFHPSSDSPSSSSRTLQIASVKTVPSLHSKNIIYLKENQETGSYLYARWSDTPPAMISRAVGLALEKGERFGSVLSPSSSLKPDWILESDLHSFYHRFESNDRSRGSVDITFRLIDPSDKRVIASRRFNITEEAASADSAGGAAALSEATLRLAEECATWITTTLQERL